MNQWMNNSERTNEWTSQVFVSLLITVSWILFTLTFSTGLLRYKWKHFIFILVCCSRKTNSCGGDYPVVEASRKIISSVRIVTILLIESIFQESSYLYDTSVGINRMSRSGKTAFPWINNEYKIQDYFICKL